MFVRRTLTRSVESGEHYYSHRLVRSERSGGRVRQVTLLNLGRHFAVNPEQWPTLCVRIDELLRGQSPPSDRDCELALEREAQRLAARLLARQAESRPDFDGREEAMESVIADSLELVRARALGVEEVALWAVEQLGLVDALQTVGVPQRQIWATVGMVVGRMAVPGVERATRRWWDERSAVGELLGVDLASFGAMLMYRTGESLLRRRQSLEGQLFSRLQDIFGLPPLEPIYDLTNTCFSGALGRVQGRRAGLTKEDPANHPPVTLGLVVDESGFVRRSAKFAGDGAWGPTLKTMLDGLEAPPGAIVAMEREVATDANLAWLRAHGYRFLVIDRPQAHVFDPDRPADAPGSGGSLEMRKVLSADGQEAHLYCRSPQRQAAEEIAAARCTARLEAGLKRLQTDIAKPDGERDILRLRERIARLKERSGAVGQLYRIELIEDANGEYATGLHWEARPMPVGRSFGPGTLCLTSSETDWDPERMWRTFAALSDLHMALNSLRPGPGLGPVDRPSEECSSPHLLVSVLACQCIQLVRRQLAEKGIRGSWQTLRQTLSGRCRLTVSFRRGDGRTLHLRSTTRADPDQLAIYRALGIDCAPPLAQKTVV